MSELKKTSFTIEVDEFEEFKKYAKLRDSDVAKELRKVIRKYNQEAKKQFKYLKAHLRGLEELTF